MPAKKTDAEKMARKLDTLPSQTEGVCDLCGAPVDEHPCGEHRAAVIAAQVRANAEEQAAAWGMDLPEPGRF